MTILGIIQGGKLVLPRGYNEFAKKNEGMRIELSPVLPESAKQRKFYHGAVLPMLAFYQENLDHHKSSDIAKVHEWIKIEFNGEFVEVGGKAQKVGRSTKGQIKDVLERLLDWMGEQGYAIEWLNPVAYKHWRDEVFPYGGPTNYIDYLVELKRI